MKPILFNTEMVRAILEGRKTVTRRVIKGQDKNTMYAGRCALGVGLFDNNTARRVIEPPYRFGDILYVRETVWQKIGHYLDVDGETKGSFCNEFLYVATDKKPETGWNYSWVKRPSIHMPKEAARLFLRVTGVKVERLQDITPEQAIKEGVKENFPPLAVDEFRDIWQSTIKKDQAELYSWEANPYVWVIEFEDISEDIKNGRV